MSSAFCMPSRPDIQRRQGGKTFMPFLTGVAFNASPHVFFHLPIQPLLRIPSVYLTGCIVSYHLASCLAGQFERRLLGFGTWFASPWAHPPAMSTLMSGWPPDWRLLRGSALSFEAGAALVRLSRSMFFINRVQIHVTFL
eukprot:364574-Chlamydomonas_euryale.AAC.2